MKTSEAAAEHRLSVSSGSVITGLHSPTFNCWARPLLRVHALNRTACVGNSRLFSTFWEPGQSVQGPLRFSEFRPRNPTDFLLLNVLCICKNMSFSAFRPIVYKFVTKPTIISSCDSLNKFVSQESLIVLTPVWKLKGGMWSFPFISLDMVERIFTEILTHFASGFPLR